VTTCVVAISVVTSKNYTACCAKCMRHNAVHATAPSTTPALVYAEGNYKEYEADLHKRKGTDADQPKRIKYKALVRG
jgi:hypothetical protein